MITFACVYRSGGDFTAEYVDKLHTQILHNCSATHRFVCLTDRTREVGPCGIAFSHNFPGWWSKFEVFRLTGKVVYFDLDNIIIQGLDKFLNGFADNVQEHFYTLRAFKDGLPCSSIMAWNGDYSWILDNFRTAYDPKKLIRTTGGALSLISQDKLYRGDQDLLRKILTDMGEPIKYIDELGVIVRSYKHHCRDGVPKGTDIVGFHGKPRPKHAPSIWVRKYWGSKINA